MKPTARLRETDPGEPSSATRVIEAARLDDAYLPLKALAIYSGLSVRTLRGYLAHPAHALPCTESAVRCSSGVRTMMHGRFGFVRPSRSHSTRW